MDQLKTVLAALKKHHFWVLCGLVVLIALTVWWLATGAVDNAFGERTGKIKGDLDQMASISTTPQHPNEPVIKDIGQRTGELKKKVLKAWEGLYKEQKEKNPLPGTLSEDFRRVFEDLGPEEEIPWEYRQEYLDFIGRHIQTLPEMVNYLRPVVRQQDTVNPDAPKSPRPPMGYGSGSFDPEAPGTSGMTYNTYRSAAYSTGGIAGEADMGFEMEGVVHWVQADREQLVQRFTWQTPPSTEQLRDAQEDLSVYEALLRIIKNTNQGATSYHNAAVKQIQALQIGREAAGAWQESEDGAFLSAEARDAEAGAAYGKRTGPPTPAESPTGSYGRDSYTSGAGGLYAGGGRYVDEEGRPLGIDDPQPYAEFKMMPICMLLVMNQTKIPRLLVECANSNMPVEVRRLSLNPGKGAKLDVMFSSPAGYGEGETGSRPGYGRAYPGSSTPSYPSSYGPAYRRTYGSGFDSSYTTSHRQGMYSSSATLGLREGTETTTLDIPIEIRGIICIYNPPNEDKLGTGAAAEKPAEVTPATPPPAPATEPAPAAPAARAGGPAVEPARARQPPGTGG